jgi:hypothetical protein
LKTQTEIADEPARDEPSGREHERENRALLAKSANAATAEYEGRSGRKSDRSEARTSAVPVEHSVVVLFFHRTE